jgi:hypothetical protein
VSGPGPIDALRVKVATVLRGYRVSAPAIHAADRDRLARAIDLRVEVTRRADVQWRIRDASGAVVRVLREPGEARAGRLERRWDGRDAKQRYVPEGRYTATVVARAGGVVVRYQQPIWVGPFRISTSDGTARRGRRLSPGIEASEPLRRPPVLLVEQQAPRTVISPPESSGRAAFGSPSCPGSRARPACSR